jgi:predicted transposase/invertase (TIGR01784 family)
MTNKRIAKEFFEQHLPEEIKKLIDFASLELCPESYIDEALKLTASDILYKANIAGKLAYIYILAEHESKADKLLPFWVIKYTTSILDRHIKQYPKKPLPLVIPLVLYTGPTPFNYSNDIKELISAPRELTDKILFQPFHLIDLNHIPDQELRERYWAGIMQFIFKHIHERDFLPYLKDITGLLQIVEREGGIEYILTITKYIMVSGQADDEEVVRLLKSELSQPTGEKIMTIAEQLIQKGDTRGFTRGVDIGRAEGRAQGRAEGRAQGQAAILLRLLTRKFGAAASHYTQHIQQASAEKLLQWGEQLLDARTLEEIFALK